MLFYGRSNVFQLQFVFIPFSDNKIMGEKSPNYFIESEIPGRILKYNPNIKIVILLCEPAARVFSDYTHFHRNIAKNSAFKLLGNGI
jgi:hypothetical protein